MTVHFSIALEASQGRIEIDAKFEQLVPPARFGAEYLTYVLWAISPEGRPANLGEVVANASEKAKLHVTTELQAFGLIVTAEPYSAVRQPSDVVIMENQARPDTMGKVETIQAKYDLMPRGHYTYDVQAGLSSAVTNAPKVPFAQYETLLELYQARNAVQMARSLEAGRYAGGTFAKAQQLLREAEDLNSRKADRRLVISAAREAAQTAEDARAISLKRKQEEEIAEAHRLASAESEKRTQAESAARQAAEEAAAARADAEAQRAARQRAEAEAAAAAQYRQLAEDRVARRSTVVDTGRSRKVYRMDLVQRLSYVLDTRDTPRGVILTLPDALFQADSVRSTAIAKLAQMANMLAASGLKIEVEGYTDGRTPAEYAEGRAEAIRDSLVRQGIPSNLISVRAFGSARPLVSNLTATGREQNRRVEIVITGDAIGAIPGWDRTYSLMPSRIVPD